MAKAYGIQLGSGHDFTNTQQQLDNGQQDILQQYAVFLCPGGRLATENRTEWALTEFAEFSSVDSGIGHGT